MIDTGHASLKTRAREERSPAKNISAGLLSLGLDLIGARD